jgi:TonB family protein
LVIASAVIAATGWWAVKTFWLTAPGTPLSVNFAPTTKYNLGKVYPVGGDVTAPIPIYKPEPGYTKEARAAKLQGTDVLWTIVDASGSVADVGLVKALDKGLDESAMQTVRTWKFKPATKNGAPVPVKVVVETSFRIY